MARTSLVVLLCCVPALAAAEPITIIVTSGFVDYDTTFLGRSDLLTLSGTDGFTVTANPVSGVTSPSGPLIPGDRTAFVARWVGLDLPGMATFRGQTFEDLGGLMSPNSVGVSFSSTSFILPQPGETGSATVRAPFTLEGTFFSRSEASPVDARFIGSGIGTLPLTFNPALGWWNTSTVHLELSAPPEVIPEPATLWLLGAGLTAAYKATRRRSPRQ